MEVEPALEPAPAADFEPAEEEEEEEAEAEVVGAAVELCEIRSLESAPQPPPALHTQTNRHTYHEACA